MAVYVWVAVLPAIFSWIALANDDSKGPGGPRGSLAGAAKALNEAGAAQAAGVVSACVDSADTVEARQACFTGIAAREALAHALGKSESQITKTDLQLALISNAKRQIAEMMANCTPPCDQGDALKAALAKAQGTGSGEVRDSEVQVFVQQASGDQALAALKNCSDADKSVCLQAAKAARAVASGRTVSSISDDQLSKDIQSAINRDIADLLTMNNNSSACWQIVSQAMQAGDTNGRVPNDYEISSKLGEVAVVITAGIVRACGSNWAECAAQINATLANALCSSSLTGAQVREYVQSAAKALHQQSIVACAEARLGNRLATCDDARESYDGLLSNAAGPKNPKAQQLAQLSANIDAGKDFVKENMKLCYSKSTEDAVDACMASFDNETEGVLRASNPNLPLLKQAALKLRSEEQASVEVLGDTFQACMSAAIAARDDRAKQICKSDLQKMCDVSGVSGSPENVIKKFRGSVFSDAAKGCDPGDRAACVQSARAELIASGLGPREFGLVKRQAAMKSAAQTWADCMLNGNSTNGINAACDDLAKTAWLLVSGADESSFTLEIAALVRKLGQALENGDTTEIRFLHKFIIARTTNSTTCLAGEEAEFMAFFSPLVARYFNNSSLFVSKGCRLVEEVAEYAGEGALGKDYTESGVEAIFSAAPELNIVSARRLGRHLAATDGDLTAGAAVQECPTSDLTCGQAITVTTTTSATGTPALPGATASAAFGAMAGLPLLLVVTAIC